jgi:hypothetical protein
LDGGTLESIGCKLWSSASLGNRKKNAKSQEEELGIGHEVRKRNEDDESSYNNKNLCRDLQYLILFTLLNAVVKIGKN